MDPTESLARVLGVQASSVELVEQLSDGHRNLSYRLRCGHEDYVLRVPARARELPGVDWQAERLALLAVEARGLAPPVVFSDADTGLLVTRFLSGRRWTHADFEDEIALTRLGQRLAVLHAIDPPTGLRRLDLAAHVVDLEDRARSVSAKLRYGARRTLDRFAPHAACLCHNDVHAGNVIDDGAICLLDWEYAAVGDPLFDLAGPICCERIDEAGQAVLLAGYRDRGGIVDLARFAAARWLYDYVMCLWEVVTSASTAPVEPPVAAMRQPVGHRLNELERVLESLDKPMIEQHFRH